LVGEPIEDGLRHVPNLRLEARCQRYNARAEANRTFGRAHDEAVGLKRCNEAIGDRAMNA
jgi:hypothetical protein